MRQRQEVQAVPRQADLICSAARRHSIMRSSWCATAWKRSRRIMSARASG
nr:hypothetical protein [Bordetella hinzii]